MAPVLTALLVLTAGSGSWLYAQQSPDAPLNPAASVVWQAGQQVDRAASAAAAIGRQFSSDVLELNADLYAFALERVNSNAGAGAGAAATKAAPASAPWSAADVAPLLPDGPEWARVAASIASRRGRRGAWGVLAGCATEGDCAAAATAFAALPHAPEGCILTLDAGELAAAQKGPAAALQSALADFTRRCPGSGGVVVLRAAQLLPPEALPALHDAMFGMGPFKGAGPVAYALLMQLDSAGEARIASHGDPLEVGEWLMDTYFDDTLGAEVGAMPDRERAALFSPTLRALRKRFEFAAPLRLSEEAERQADAEEAEPEFEVGTMGDEEQEWELEEHEGDGEGEEHEAEEEGQE